MRFGLSDTRKTILSVFWWYLCVVHDLYGNCDSKRSFEQLVWVQIFHARTEKTWTSMDSFSALKRPKSKNKKNGSRYFVEVSETARIFEIEWIVFEIFLKNDLEISGLNLKKTKFSTARTNGFKRPKSKNKKTVPDNSLKFQKLPTKKESSE